jgi:hypothetical protein
VARWGPTTTAQDALPVQPRDNLFLAVENTRDNLNTIRVVLRRHEPSHRRQSLEAPGAGGGGLAVLHPDTFAALALLSFGDVYAGQASTLTMHVQNDSFEKVRACAFGRLKLTPPRAQLDVALDSTEGSRVRFALRSRYEEQPSAVSLLEEDDLTEGSVAGKREEEEGSRFAVDGLVLEPGAGADVLCAYRPAPLAVNPTKMQRQAFKVLLKSHKSVVAVNCEARVVQSLVVVGGRRAWGGGLTKPVARRSSRPRWTLGTARWGS